MHRLVLLRHGQSVWNLENRFTGWRDVDLSKKGHKEATVAADQIIAEGFEFDIAYTSTLKRAIRTLWIYLDRADRMWLPVVRDWHLNERHYGGLQGLSKSETTEKHGREQVLLWRRSFDVPPPALEESDDTHPRHDRRYAGLEPNELPSCECLKDTLDRVIPYWEHTLAPDIRAGKRLLIVAHRNSLRALVKHLARVSNDDIQLNIPTGIPFVVELNDNLEYVSQRYLGDPENIRAADQTPSA